jgi:hypothetical protein
MDPPSGTTSKMLGVGIYAKIACRVGNKEDPNENWICGWKMLLFLDFGILRRDFDFLGKFALIFSGGAVHRFQPVRVRFTRIGGSIEKV